MGVVGLETAFPALYTRLVDTGALTLESLIELMSVKPRRIFRLDGGVVEEGAPSGHNRSWICGMNMKSGRKNLNPWAGVPRLKA